MADNKILLVEDEAIVAQDIKGALESFGYSVIYIANTGEDAVKKASELMPDLILMDIVLKGEINGINAVTKIKNLNIPVIYLTAHSEETVIERAKLTEPAGYIIKPYDPIQLKYAIEFAIYKSKMESRLKESESKYKLLVEGQTDLIVELDAQGRILFINPSFCEKFGKTKEELFGKKFIPQIYEDESKEQLMNCFYNPPYTCYFEQRAETENGLRWISWSNKAVLDDDNNITAILGIGRDITNEKQVENALKESEERLKLKLDKFLSPDYEIEKEELKNIINTQELQSLMNDLYDVTYMGIGIIDMEGTVLVDTGWQDICTKFHRVNEESCKNCIESDLILSKNIKPGEFRAYKCKNNMWDISTPITIGEKHVGNIFLGQFFYEDEEIDYSIFEKQAEKYGFDKEKYIKALNNVPRWSKRQVNSLMKFYSEFAKMISKLSYSNIKLAKTLLDYKIAQDELKKSEERFKIVADFTYDWEYWVDPDGNFVYVSPSCERITGYTPDEFIQDPGLLEKIAHPDDVELVKEHHYHLSKTERDSEYLQFRIINKDGEERWIGHGCQPAYNEKGEYLGRRASNRDITKRKELDDNLRKSRDWLSFTQKAARSGFWDWDLKKDVITWSPELLELFRLPKDTEPTFDSWIEILHPDDRESASNNIKKAIENHEFLVNEYRVIVEGKEIWIRALGTPYYDENNTPVRMSGICIDITKMKTDEIKKNEAELKYQSLFKNMLNGFAYCKMIYKDDEAVDFIYLNVNKSFESLTGLKDVTGKKVSEIIPGVQETDKELFEIYGRVASTGQPETFEMYLKSLEDWYSVSVYCPQKGYFAAIFEVITEQKVAEERLKTSEKKYRALFEADPDYTILLNSDGVLIDVNHAATEVLGLSRNELIGKHFTNLNIFPEDELQKNIKNFSLFSKGKGLPPFESKIFDYNGKIRFIDVKTTFVKIDEKTLYILLICSDITQRKKAEYDIKSSLKEKDVLLQEIHHRVKNNMQIISSLLNLQKQHVDNEKAVNVLLESQNRVKTMAMIHEKLYTSKNLNEIKFEEYIPRLVSDLLRSYSDSTDQIELETQIEDVGLNIETAVPCGLIINELVSNSLKYAFPDYANGKLTISFKALNEMNELIISDNGVGFPEELDFKNTETLGLQLVNNLVNQLEGEITLDRSHGTSFKIVFKELKYNKRV